jgi:hypothetical protein
MRKVFSRRNNAGKKAFQIPRLDVTTATQNSSTSKQELNERVPGTGATCRRHPD